ncbi:MAG: hypothetical protein ND895_08915 [Pyrinomonadaceae bacterium]|nr:hypothetical protein [Pyrinomonadaceae bacterium]
MFIALNNQPPSPPFGVRNSTWQVLIKYRSAPPNGEEEYSLFPVYKHLTPALKIMCWQRHTTTVTESPES